MNRARLFTAGLAIILSACRPAPEDRRASAAEAVRAADIAWDKAFSRRDTSAAVAAVEPTGSVLAPNAPIATGPEAIRALFTGFYAMPGLSIHWQPTKVEAARSGDLAYSTGTSELTFRDPKGEADPRSREVCHSVA
jgi:ketosteroid isomerase-like protein